MEEDHGVDEQGKEEVDEHTTDHDQQPLPGGLCAELPRLFWLFHLFRIETLVDHTGNLTVTTERQPTHTVLRVAVLRFELKQTSVPFPDAGVEEQIELIYADAKQLGEEEMATLMEQHQQADGQHKL